jgi:hypothetical protein
LSWSRRSCLTKTRSIVLFSFGADAYDGQLTVFTRLAHSQIAPVTSSLAARFTETGRYPNDESQLRTMLAESGLDLQSVRDPWVFRTGRFSQLITRPTCSVLKVQALTSVSTQTMISGSRANRWLYFLPVGKAIDEAVRAYHKRTGGFIRDFATLRVETGKEGYDLDMLRDRWDQPYRIMFDVNRDRFVINVRSGGPDKQFFF